MESKSTPPPLGKALQVSAQYAARTREGLRAGLSDARTGTLRVPSREEHARRLLFGFTAPLTLMRAAWGQAEIRRSMVHRLLPPLLFIALCTGLGVFDLVETLVAAHRDPATLAAEVRKDKKTKDDDDDEDSDTETSDEAKAAIAKAGTEVESAVAKAAKDEEAKGSSQLDVAAAALSAAAVQVEAAHAHVTKAKPPPPPPPAPPPAGGLAVLKLMSELVQSKLAKLLATLQVIEWILVWIGREHHDVIAYDTSVLTGVPSEPPPNPPRLRLDLAWVKMKGWRALRFLVFLSLAAPIVWLLGMIPDVGGAVGVVAESAWVAYWASVFAIANTFLAWEAPVPEGWAPWFVRVLRWAGRVPLLGIPLRIYGRVLAFATRKVWPACRAFEEASWEAAGLALARGIASVPVLYILSRPMFTPAATHAFVARCAPARQDATAPELGEGPVGGEAARG